MSKADLSSSHGKSFGRLFHHRSHHSSQSKFFSAVAPGRKSVIRRFWFPAVLLLAITAGGMTGLVIAYQLNYSRYAVEVAALASYRPSSVTRVYADDG
ncbi:MAG: hypothetical protein ACRD63_16870, partial [Pyrinomonadaceae bacterium]